jgi:Domain of unknown function (DUF5615)
LTAGIVIPFFTDNDVEDEVGNVLTRAGHSVIRLRDVMLGNSPDPVVDANCRNFSLVLITHNYKDFRAIAKKLESAGEGIKRLSRIDLKMHQSLGPRRILEALHLIEAEWRRYSAVSVTIGEEVITFRK